MSSVPVSTMESSEGTDSFEATFIIVTVVFVVVALILTALAVVCIMCRAIPEQMEGTTGEGTKKSFLENIYYSVVNYRKLPRGFAVSKHDINSPLETYRTGIRTEGEANEAAEEGKTYYSTVV